MLRGGCVVLVLALALPDGARAADPAVHFRASQAGYRPDDLNRVIVFAEAPVKGRFKVRDEAGRVVLRGRLPPPLSPRWGRFGGHHELSLDALHRPGRYAFRIGRTEAGAVVVSPDANRCLAAGLLEFLRRQRCGYNAFLNVVCHALDGRTAYGPRPAGSYVDARGGWHDAGDRPHASASTGVANLAGRYAAAMALAWQTWKHDPRERPFMNAGHFVLAGVGDDGTRGEVAAFYREGLETASRLAARNAYGAGAPFIWCSNNLIVAVATQAALYEKMTGDARFRPLLFSQWAWLLGRNPWAVYHDDVMDYSTNEPTMDGTASAVLLGALMAGGR
jgi:hypothetical protein